MLVVGFIFALFAYETMGQSDNCNFGEGYNITAMSSEVNNPITQGDYASYYKNGTFVQYHRSGVIYGTGDYVNVASDSKTECYSTLTWKTGPLRGKKECSTFSPSKDKHGTVGCFDFNTNACPKECTLEFILANGHGWFASFILNPLSDDA
eukprot:452133_1